MKSKFSANRILTILFGAVILIASASFAFAQENTGSIRGTVKDPTGATIPGAKVTASSPALVRSLDATSDKEGSYRFPKLPVGIYSITVTQTGFKTVKNEDISVVLGSELTLDVSLSAGNVTESVTISASSEAIDVTSSKSATSINEKFIENTPKGRGFNTLLQSAPGVIFDPRAGSAGSTGYLGGSGTNGNSPGGGVGGYSVNGASGSENQFILDGVEVSNVRNAALGRESSIPFEFVREVQVKSGGFEAEYGGAVGGVVNVVTKSGADQFHGEGALMFTGAGLNSRARGFWRGNPTAVTTAQFFRQKEDEYRTFFPGFTIGGPILKDRLHFFSGYFPELSRAERSIAYPNGAETTTTRILRHYAINRLDYAPTQKIQINTSYIWTPIRVTGTLKGVDPLVARPLTDQSIQGGFTPAQAYTASFTYTATSNLILSARYGYKYTNDKGNTYGLPTVARVTYNTNTSLQTNPAVPASLAGAAGFTNTSSPFTVVKDTLTRHNVYLDGTYITRFLGQQHTFKGGYALNRIANTVIDDYPNGDFTVNWGESFNRGTLAQNRRGAYGYYTWQDGVRHNNGANSRNQGYYFQDQWQIHPRVTINAGFRIENEFLPPFTKTAANGAAIPNPIRFGWGDKVAPRFGGAWDVLGNAKWKISASFGHFYDTLKYELARSSFGGDYWFSHVYQLDDPTKLASLNKQNPGAAGVKILSFDNRSVPVNAQGELDGIDPDIHATYSRAFSVASEHQLSNNMVASVRYTRNRLKYPIEDIGIFDSEENEVYVIGNPGYGLRSTSISELNGVKLNLKAGQFLNPKAIRNYDGVEFRLDGRLTGDWVKGLSYNLSYTYSRLYGNYPGLASSDENGRSQPNVSRSFDLPYNNFDSKGNNVFGLLNTDRPHVFKLFGAYPINWMGGTTTLSLAQFIQSGVPRSTELAVVVPVYIYGRNDLGRTPAVTQTDLLLAHSFKLSEGKTLKLDANVINLFNQAAPVNYNIRINRTGNLSVGAPGHGVLTDQQFFTGFDPSIYIKDATTPVSTTSLPRSPFYNLPTAYQGIREIRLGLHFIF